MGSTGIIYTLFGTFGSLGNFISKCVKKEEF
jgi:hypothetical protein